MSSFFRRQRCHLCEIGRRDTLWVTHDFLSICFVLSVQVLVNVLIVEILVHDAVDRHEVLYDGDSEGQSAINLLTSEMIVCHFEGKLSLLIDTICCRFVVFVKH